MCHKALKIIAAAVQDLIVSDGPIWLSGLEADCLCSKVSKSLPCPLKAWSNELKPLMKGQLWSKVDLTFQTPPEIGSLTLEHQLPNTIQDTSLDKHLVWKDDELIFETRSHHLFWCWWRTALWRSIRLLASYLGPLPPQISLWKPFVCTFQSCKLYRCCR